MMRDLFGNQVEPVPPKAKHLGIRQQWKLDNNYRKGDTATCKDCLHLRKYEYHDKTYYKCVLLGESHSTATDIRVSYVCNEHKESEG